MPSNSVANSLWDRKSADGIKVSGSHRATYPGCTRVIESVGVDSVVEDGIESLINVVYSSEKKERISHRKNGNEVDRKGGALCPVR